MEMATRDIDTGIRVSAVQVLCAMDKIGLLSDDEDDRREKLGWLIYDKEARIRKAVASFVRSMWQDEVDELKERAKERGHKAKNVGGQRRANKKQKGKKKAAPTAEKDDSELSNLDEDEELDVGLEGNDDLKEHFVGLKALASLLGRFSDQLSQSDKAKPKDSILEDNDEGMEDVATKRAKELLASIKTVTSDAEKHAWVAVDALWNEVHPLQDWEKLVKYLSIDHTSSDITDEVWALEEEEETFMIEAMLAVLRKTEDVAKGKKVRALQMRAAWFLSADVLLHPCSEGRRHYRNGHHSNPDQSPSSSFHQASDRHHPHRRHSPARTDDEAGHVPGAARTSGEFAT
jgi:cohesin complex subunit SA-1/2